MRTEDCACGGTITVPDRASPAPYIEGHNSTPEHWAWRQRANVWREWPTAGYLTGDVSLFWIRASASPSRRPS